MLASMATALASSDSDDHLRFGVDVLIVGIWAYAQGRAETPAEKPPATDSASK